MSEAKLPGDPWQYATWEGSELAELLRGHRMPLANKLAWLEEMAELVTQLAPQHDQGNEEATASTDWETI